MKINYFSDIHLEFGWLESPDTNADIVVAAGDIGVGTEAVSWLARCDAPVIYIAGNHEFYGGDIQHTRRDIANACATTNVVFLEGQEYMVGDVRFLGTTLWTDFANGDQAMLSKAASHMNDYQQIGFGERRLKPQDILQINSESSAWLRRKLAEDFDGKTVVVTHHAPSIKSWDPPPQNRTYVATYCNQLENLIEDSDVALWIHGHIHHRADYLLGGTRVVCNPRGYHGYQTVSGFDETTIVEI